MRKFYWYLTAFLKKHGFIVISSLLVATIFFYFLLPPLIDSLAVQKRYYIGMIGESTLTNLPSDITNQLSLGLTVTKVDGSILPALADRWTVEQDGKTYRFVLKDNIIWQDGTPVTPSDIQYSFPDVETIITPNDIVFKLPSPFAPFPTSVSQPLLKQGTLNGPLFIKRPTLIGIGPYAITNYKRQGNRLKELVVDGNGERFIYRFYQTEDDAIIAFKRGEIDRIPSLAREHDIYSWQRVTINQTLNQDRYLALFFNMRDPLFTKSVRQALSYAIEKEQNEERAIGPISPLSWAYLPGGKTYDEDWERGSERLLAEPPGQPLTFEIMTTALFAAEAENMKKAFEAFGAQVYADCTASTTVTDKTLCENVRINVTIRVNNFPDTSNFQTLLIGQEVPSDPDQYSLWHSSESTNFTGYKNTRIDNLLEKGRQTYDQQERTEIYQEFQQFFLEDPPAMFLRYLWNYEVIRENKI